VVKRTGLMILLLVVLGAGGWYFFLRSTDREKVLGRLNDLAEYVTKAPGEKGTGLLLKSQLIGRLFADHCEISVDFHNLSGSYTPEELGANLVRSRQFVETIQLSFYDTSVRFPQPDTALLDTTGQVLGKAKNGDRFREVRELAFTLKKIDGKWRFTVCRIREVLRK